MNISDYVGETASSAAAAANKATAVGAGALGVGWISNTTILAQVGFAITVLGGVWSFVMFLRQLRDAKAKRAEEEAANKLLAEQSREEHALRLRILERQLEDLSRVGSGAPR